MIKWRPTHAPERDFVAESMVLYREAWRNKGQGDSLSLALFREGNVPRSYDHKLRMNKKIIYGVAEGTEGFLLSGSLLPVGFMWPPPRKMPRFSPQHSASIPLLSEHPRCYDIAKPTLRNRRVRTSGMYNKYKQRYIVAIEPQEILINPKYYFHSWTTTNWPYR